MNATTREVCPLCKHPETNVLFSMPMTAEPMQEFLRTYYEGRVNEGFVEGITYIVSQCTKCNGCFQQEILNDQGMEMLYSTWIKAAESKVKAWDPRRQLELARHIARLTKLFPNPHEAELLDYGMGWGDWCHMAQSFGFKATGVELSQERITFAAERGITAYLPNQLPEKQYDFVYLEQVLEHLPTPYETIEHITAITKPGGYVHIGVPDGTKVPGQATESALLRKGPAHPLEHINIFSRASLITFMAQFGLKPVPQREVLLRCTNVPTLLRDFALMGARFLPASMFPPTTSLLFQKA